MNDTTFQGDGKITFVPVVVNAKKPKQTNADLIRSATDEELAEFMANNVGCDDCRFFATCRSAPQDRACAEKWLDWLKEEAKNEL